ncbi:ABC transporter ATP-binding protein [Mycoplasma sp. ATU-Cv-703]|uniref:ATP-binding cassette domain-containing protein n=1 Tax=Mycoplasma sp. ATU-Cv-703 TaxID=2498595 RepID=UPI000FDEBE09
MNKVVIEVQNITKIYKQKIANDDISFVVRKGERVGVIGQNGAGKTTLVEQIVGITKPSKGKIIYHFPYKRTPQEKMGIQFQDSSYPEGLTVKDVINFQLDIYGSTISRRELLNMLHIFQVDEFYHKKAKGLSGGQLQKINVLLAVIHNPEVVVLDEISTGLDISAREEILNYVEKYLVEKKMTTFLISHNMSEIERLCRRVILLDDGKIHYDGPLSDILKQHGSLGAYVVKFLQSRKKAKELLLRKKLASLSDSPKKGA